MGEATISLVEIHQYFIRGRRITVDYDALWGRAVPMDKDGVRCRRLSPEDTRMLKPVKPVRIMMLLVDRATSALSYLLWYARAKWSTRS